MGNMTTLVQPRVDCHIKDKADGQSRDLMDIWLTLADGLGEDVLRDSKVTRTQLLQTVQDVMGAGIETTTNIVHWALLYMAANPLVQVRNAGSHWLVFPCMFVTPSPIGPTVRARS